MIIAAIVTVPDTVRSPLIYYLTKPSSFFFFFTSFIRFFFSHIKLHGSYRWSLGPCMETGVGPYKMVSEFLIRRLGEHRLFPEISWKWYQKWPWQSCPGWQYSPWQRCNSHQCQPSSGATWAQGPRRCQCP